MVGATIGKHGRTVTMPITEEIEAILLRCGAGKGGAFVPHHPEWVHTYVCQRADKRKGLVKGERRTQMRTSVGRAQDRGLKSLGALGAAAVCVAFTGWHTSS
jgi:hypothetical protein